MRNDPGLWNFTVSATCTKTGHRVYATRRGIFIYLKYINIIYLIIYLKDIKFKDFMSLKTSHSFPNF